MNSAEFPEPMLCSVKAPKKERGPVLPLPYLEECSERRQMCLKKCEAGWTVARPEKASEVLRLGIGRAHE